MEVKRAETLDASDAAAGQVAAIWGEQLDTGQWQQNIQHWIWTLQLQLLIVWNQFVPGDEIKDYDLQWELLEASMMDINNDVINYKWSAFHATAHSYISGIYFWIIQNIF